jgi:cbb3-type cytochrome oxidase maturation protein
MADYEILGPYVIAILMGMGGLCIFVWGVLSGAFNDTDEAALRFYRAEMENDRKLEQAGK